MRLSRLFIAALVLLAGAGARASTPVITKIPGHPVEAVFASGNRAGLFVSFGPPAQTDAAFLVSENTCTGKPGHVSMKLSFSAAELRWVWTKHPTKQGKVAEESFDGSSFPLSVSLFLSHGSRFIDPRLSAGLPDDELTFDSLDWLPDMPGGVLHELVMPAWSAELMRRNPQTGVDENRIWAGEYGLRLVPTGPLSARLIHSTNGGYFSVTVLHYLHLFGDVVSWTLPQGRGICQIAFKPSLNEKPMLEYLKNMPRKFQPYNYKQDGLDQIYGFFIEGEGEFDE